jgi:hypothetical protein
MLAAKSWQKLAFITLIVGDAGGILDKQLWLHPIHLHNLIIITLLIFL